MKFFKRLIVGILAAAFVFSMVGCGALKDKEEGVLLELDVRGYTSDEKDEIERIVRRRSNDITYDSRVKKVDQYTIMVEIPGQTDIDEMTERILGNKKLYFITQKNDRGENNYEYTGNTDSGYELLYSLKELKKNGSIIVTEENVVEAEVVKNNYDYMVQVKLDDKGTEAFKEATENACKNWETIAVYYGNDFLMVPVISSPILNGELLIQGNFYSWDAEQIVQDLTGYPIMKNVTLRDSKITEFYR